MRSFLAPFTALSDSPVEDAIQDAFAIPAPLSSPALPSDNPRAAKTRAVVMSERKCRRYKVVQPRRSHLEEFVAQDRIGWFQARMAMFSSTRRRGPI
jgi:hypothetical protein